MLLYHFFEHYQLSTRVPNPGRVDAMIWTMEHTTPGTRVVQATLDLDRSGAVPHDAKPCSLIHRTIRGQSAKSSRYPRTCQLQPELKFVILATKRRSYVVVQDFVRTEALHVVL